MAIGDLLRSIVGINPSDPVGSVVPAATGAQQPPAATPIPAPATPGAGTPPAGQDGQPAAAPAAPMAAPAAPPDLTTLYQKLMDKDRAQRSMDSGLTLMAAGLASPENRAALIGMASNTQNANQGNVATTLKTLMGLQANQDALMRKEILRKQLPAIAKQYGISMEAAQQMFEAGKLDEYIAKTEGPDGYKTVTDPSTGKTIQMRGGKVIQTLDTGLAPNMHVQTDASTGNATATDLNHPDKKVDLGGGLKPDTRLVEDKKTGNTVVVDGNNGAIKGNIGTGLAPNYQQVKDPATGETTLVDLNNPTTAPHIKLGTGKDMDTNVFKDYQKYLNDPLRKGDPMDFDTFKTNHEKTAATQTVTDKSSQAVVTAFAPEWKQMHQEGQAAYETNAKIRSARGQIEDPNFQINAGSKMSPYTQDGRKVLADMFGLPADKATVNTDAFFSQMKEIVLPKVKALGTGNSISDADRSFIEKAVGSQDMSPDTLRRILRIMDVSTRIDAINKASKLKGLQAGMDPDAAKFVPIPQVPEFDASAIPHVPPGAIEKLKQNPELRADFDKKYGRGMKLSTYVLGN